MVIFRWFLDLTWLAIFHPYFHQPQSRFYRISCSVYPEETNKMLEMGSWGNKLSWLDNKVTFFLWRSKRVKNKWNEIAKELYVCSNKKFFRTPKQCREHWINHLDPKPIRSEWTLSEDFELVKAVNSIGKKWARVSKKLEGRRTEHMVKNRFKSLYHSHFKNLNKNDQRSLCEVEIIAQI